VNRLPLLLLSLAGFALCSCESDKTKFTLSVHSEGSEMESPRSIMPDMIGNPPRKVILKRSPEFTHNNIAAYHAFPADNGNGNGVALRLDFKGTQALELVTRMRQGEILRAILNGKGVDYVMIDRPITDGIFTIWEGVPDEVIAEMGKKYPTITGLPSASSNMDMTPSTKTEKKKAFRFFKKSERAAAAEKADSTSEPPQPAPAPDAAAIQTPAPPAPAVDAGAGLDPLPELPKSAAP
jgi:hypothetical protein